MQKLDLVAPCHFGLEAVLKREIYDLGYDVTRVEDGRVTFAGDAEAVCRANIFLRSAERVLIQAGRFPAKTYDELFEGVRAIPWEGYLPSDARFWVKKASSVKSALFSPSDIQSIVKKAVVERMKSHYHIEWFREDGADYPLRVFLFKDEAMVALDTSGESLHKRGYRLAGGAAPLSETLAASLIMLTPWHADRILVDPFCGSGTFLIEAAMMAANIAPGRNRGFIARDWPAVPEKNWREAMEEADELSDASVSTAIQGYDADEKVVALARDNARRAGVDHLIHFQARSVSQLSHSKKYGFLIANPPYGERMEDKESLPAIYRELGEAYRRLEGWSMYILTAFEDAERCIGRKADKNRKLYNGMIRTYFYQFLGPKPPKRDKEGGL